MYNKIQSYKQLGYTIRRCARTIDLDRKTVRKYWHMSPEEYTECLSSSKKRTKILDPYSEEIINELREYPNITSAIIYDHLRERHEGFKPSYRSVHLYVRALREELGIPTEVKIRQYTEVSETPPGFQSQVDMGQMVMVNPFGKKVKVYIFAMVMSLSRKKFVHLQDHPYDSKEFVKAHDLAFKYYGGRTDEIVYDQDRVMAVSENAGDLVLTEVFDTYRKYAGFLVRLCRGHDPESKGKIESVVKYVKGNFLSCRIYHGISALNSECLSWLDRTANARIHETTRMVPENIFSEEARHLSPVPELSKPVQPKIVGIRKTNVVPYRQNRYQVPKGTYSPGREARIIVDKEGIRVSFYDARTGEFLAEHTVDKGVGRLVKLNRSVEKFGGKTLEQLKDKLFAALDSFDDGKIYAGWLIEKYPRYARDQLRIMYQCVTGYSRTELKKALDYCVQRELISANDFKDTLAFFRQEEPKISPTPVTLPAKYQSVAPKVRNIADYLHSGSKGGEVQ